MFKPPENQDISDTELFFFWTIHSSIKSYYRQYTEIIVRVEARLRGKMEVRGTLVGYAIQSAGGAQAFYAQPEAAANGGAGPTEPATAEPLSLAEQKQPPAIRPAW